MHPPSSSLTFASRFLTGKNPCFGAFQPGSDQDLALPAQQPQSHWQQLLRCPGSFSRTAEFISASPRSSAISQLCLSYQLCPFCLQGNLGGFCREERDSLPTFPQYLQTVLVQSDTTAAFFLGIQPLSPLAVGLGQTREQRTKPQKSSTEAKRRKAKPSSPNPSQGSWSLDMNPSFLVENPELSRGVQLPSGILMNLWAWKQSSDLFALVESHEQVKRKEPSDGHCQNRDGSAVPQSSAHLANMAQTCASKNPRK